MSHTLLPKLEMWKVYAVETWNQYRIIAFPFVAKKIWEQKINKQIKNLDLQENWLIVLFMIRQFSLMKQFNSTNY